MPFLRLFKNQDAARGSWLLRYGLAIVCFAATIGLSLLLAHYAVRISLTIPIVLALVITAWFGGRGPGLLISALFVTTTIIYTPLPPDSTIARAVFGYLSILFIYVFLVFLISGLRNVQHALREHRDLLQITLTSIGDAVLTTDIEGIITFMNPVAEKMTGWTGGSAIGRPLTEVLRIVNEQTREPVPNPVDKVISTGSVVGLANHTVLISRDGREIPIDDSAAPILDKGKMRGVVLVFSDVSARKLAEHSRRENELMHGLIDAQEGERRRIARDLHDHLGQKMTALRLQIEMLSEKCQADPELQAVIGSVQESASMIDRDIAFLSWELRPTELENLGLADALTSYVREWSAQYDIEAEFHASKGGPGAPDARLSQEFETNLYRIAQESLNNVLKHAEATRVSVLLQFGRESIVLMIEDDGRGFTEPIHTTNSSSPGGLGLIGMRERAEILNGTLEIDSEPGRGTAIVVRIPIPAESAAAAGGHS